MPRVAGLPEPRARPPGQRAAGGARTLKRMVGELQDDAALMLAYAAGDAAAFERLYQQHKGPLFRYLMRHLRDRELANDLFQDVWGRLIAARKSYQPRARFQTYLFTLAHNCIVDHWRRINVRPVGNSVTLDPDDAHPSLRAAEHEGPEQRAREDETKLQLRAALAALPREQRDAFLLYEESGLSLDDIAAVMGVGIETAKSRLRYAVAKLREQLAPLAEEEFE